MARVALQGHGYGTEMRAAGAAISFAELEAHVRDVEVVRGWQPRSRYPRNGATAFDRVAAEKACYSG